jgi:thioredoxin-related protein
MKHIFQRAVALLLAVGITACGTTDTPKKPEPTDEQKAFGPTGIPPQLRTKTNDDTTTGTTTVTPGGKRDTSGMSLTPMEDIVFTSETQVPQLAELLAAPKAKIWEESETIARRRSAREGKPLLLWFTNSKFSPNCKALEQELFSKADFGAWATEKLVRMKVDAGFQATDPELSIAETETRTIDVKHYTAALKKRFKVMGHPTLILLNPSGEVIGRYAGYKRGSADFTWGLLKHAESVSTRAYTAWRADMEKRGYRDWQDRRGRKAFAKAVGYTKGELILIDPDGSRFRTRGDQLSDTDRTWLAEQSRLRPPAVSTP